jgi:hypothetical protein
MVDVSANIVSVSMWVDVDGISVGISIIILLPDITLVVDVKAVVVVVVALVDDMVATEVLVVFAEDCAKGLIFFETFFLPDFLIGFVCLHSTGWMGEMSSPSTRLLRSLCCVCFFVIDPVLVWVAVGSEKNE